MHERVQLCEDPQTEFAILRESLRVSRINHILGVHGHTIFQEQEATQIFDVGQRSLQRLFPGFTEDSSEQATVSASQSGTGTTVHRMLPTPAHLGALIAAKPLVLHMSQGAAKAGLLPEQPLLARLDTSTETATAAFLDALDDSENPTA